MMTNLSDVDWVWVHEGEFGLTRHFVIVRLCDGEWDETRET